MRWAYLPSGIQIRVLELRWGKASLGLGLELLLVNLFVEYSRASQVRFIIHLTFVKKEKVLSFLFGNLISKTLLLF